MTEPDPEVSASTPRAALEAASSSARLRAALAAGTTPVPDHVEVLIDRCAIEPDFYVRDMLTWALVRNDTSLVLERLLTELGSDIAQARSQALHTLSKIAQPDTWPAITSALLQDKDDEVARTAWRTATGLVPSGEKAALAQTLSTQFNRGGRELQLSLSRAFLALGTHAAATLDRAKIDSEPGVRVHAIATERLMHDPDAGFDAAIAEARRVVALGDSPAVTD